MKNPLSVFRKPKISQGDIKIRDAMGIIDNIYGNEMRSRSLYNPLSGAGGATDKGSFFTFLPFWLNDNLFIERVCNQSWMAERFVSMPVNDMFAKPREFDGDEAFGAEFLRLGIDQTIAKAMRLGRQYGTGLFWLITKESSSETPLDLNKIRAGDIVNCIAVDRQDASVLSKTKNPMSTNFNKPELYKLNINEHGSVTVHHSRIYRSDGLESDSTNGWKMYDRDWGASCLATVMTDVFNDSSVVEAVSHLIQEASIPVHKVEGLSEIMCSGKLEDEQSVDELMEQVNMYKSIYRTVFMDGDDQFDRTSVNFSNIPDLIDRFEERMAMASGMSVTRFLGKGASGLNATGEGDQRNDSKTTRIRQCQMLEPFYNWIDPLVARTIGGSVPTYVFPPLFEMSQKELSEVELNRAKTSDMNIKSGVWNPMESAAYVATGTIPSGSTNTEYTDPNKEPEAPEMAGPKPSKSESKSSKSE